MAHRNKSLPAQVAAAGGIDAWNDRSAEVRTMSRYMEDTCHATNVVEALREVKAFMYLGHNLWAYMYMRKLYNRDMDLYYSTLLAEPELLMPVVYTPTVGEACQKFGMMPMYRRGCYVSSADKGHVKAVLEEYASAECEKGPDGKPLVDCIVFTDGGRILGLGDLGAWGMGIPIGKLDLYTVCAGINPRRTIPVVIDAGCGDKEKNTAHLVIRDSIQYTGQKIDRVVQRSAAGTIVNRMYHDEKDDFIGEFMQSCMDVFGNNTLLQFEDFDSNDAFPLLAKFRDKFPCYNDDIQGTASVCVAGLLGAIKLKKPSAANLIEELRKEVFLFHGAGSANLGGMMLLHKECGVPKEQIFVTNSRGVMWKSADGKEGTFRNEEQKEFAQVGKPAYNSLDLVQAIRGTKATCLIGAVGRDPGCFTKTVVEAMVEVNKPHRPIIFALSNPKTQAEITAVDCYEWSGGVAIYGSGTAMGETEVNGSTRIPAQVNNVYIFPGMSMGAVACHTKSIPEKLFRVAAEAVAHTLDIEDMKSDRVLPGMNKIRLVGLNVATAVVMHCQETGLARNTVGKTKEEVERAVREMMFVPLGGEVLAEHALEDNSKQQVQSPPPIAASTAAKRAARQLPVDSDLNELLAAGSKLRAVKVVIDKKRPRFVAGHKIEATSSLTEDFNNVTEFLQGTEPCGVLVKLKDDEKTFAGAENSDWVVITYVPEGLKQREKVTWGGAGDSFISNYPEKRIVEWRISKFEEVSYFAFAVVAKMVLTKSTL